MRIEPDIRAAASASVCVESTPAGTPSRQTAFAARFAHAQQLAFANWHPAAHDMHVHTLLDVVVDVRSGVLMKGDAKLARTRYLVSDSSFDALELRERDMVGIGTGRAAVIGFNMAYHNHYHWVAQCVPAIEASLRVRGREGVCIAMAGDGSGQREWLDLMGYGGLELIRLEMYRQYRIPQGVFSDYLVGEGSFAVSALAADVYRRIREAVGPPAPATERIYVARTDATNRKLLNEAELIALVTARGYRVVVPGQLGVREQVDCFRRARVVVGPHGAGLANIAFCQPGTILYELVPGNYRNSCFHALALTGEVNAIADAFDGPCGGAPVSDPWSADLDRVAARLDEIEAMLATGPRTGAKRQRAHGRTKGEKTG